MKISNYIDEYQNHSGVTAALNADTLRRPYVAYLSDTGKIDWNTKEPDYASMPLTYEFLSDGEFEFYETFGKNYQINFKRINGEYASDEWKILSSRSNPKTRVHVKAGDLVQFGGNTNYYTSGETFLTIKVTNATYNVYGNIMSLLDKENFANMTSFPKVDLDGRWYRFPLIFARSTGLLNAENLVLPVLNLTDGGGKLGVYDSMFLFCTNLKTAPKLPATVLGECCYHKMFAGCSNLTGSIVLPAKTLPYGAGIGLWGCYCDMFKDCSKLDNITCLATENLIGAGSTSLPLNGWVYNVSPTGTFVKHPDAVWPTGPSGIPEGWTVIDADV